MGAMLVDVCNSRLTNLKPEDFYIENLAITPSNVVIRRSVLDHVGHFAPQPIGLEDLGTLC